MEKYLTPGLLALMASVALVFGGENLLKNGGFEEIHKTPKASSKYYMGKIKDDKCDFGVGPMLTLPAHHTVGAGSLRLRVNVSTEEEKNHEVKEGQHSVTLEAIGNGGHLQIGSATLVPGKYKLSFYYKGSGTISACTYCYGMDETISKVKFLRTLSFLTVAGKDEFRLCENVFELPNEKVDGIATFNLAFSINKNAKMTLDDLRLVKVKEQ